MRYGAPFAPAGSKAASRRTWRPRPLQRATKAWQWCHKAFRQGHLFQISSIAPLLAWDPCRLARLSSRVAADEAAMYGVTPPLSRRANGAANSACPGKWEPVFR